MKLHFWHVVQPAFDMSARRYAGRRGLLLHQCTGVCLLLDATSVCLTSAMVSWAVSACQQEGICRARGSRCWGPDAPFFHNSEQRRALEWTWSACTAWMPTGRWSAWDVLMQCILQLVLSERSPVPLLCSVRTRARAAAAAEKSALKVHFWPKITIMSWCRFYIPERLENHATEVSWIQN